MRRPFSFWFVFFVLVFGYRISHRLRFRDGYLHVCRLVDREFYRDDDEVRRWVAKCFNEGKRLRLGATRASILDYLSSRMREFSVSHFYISDPPATQITYLGDGVGTGIHSRYVDGRLIVHRLTPQSSAELAGVKVGDEIVSIPEVEEVSPRSATFRTGTYRLLRRGRPMAVEIRGATTFENQAMSVRTLDNGTRVVNMPGFLAKQLTSEEVARVEGLIAGAPRLIVDLRENLGGSLGGVQRLLGLFLPAGRPVGAIENRFGKQTVVDVSEALGDWGFGALMDRASHLDLRVAGGHTPYEGPVTVLVDSATGSAAEMFADAMRSRPNTRIWGWETAGAVVLGVVHPLPEFGYGFSVTIPHATTLTADGRNIEGHPITPDRTLFYEIEAALRGEDNWITEASR